MERRWIGAPEPLAETSGVGAQKAGLAARRLVDRGATALVSWGVAGGLDPKIGPGAVVLPDAVIGADGSRLRVDAEWRDRLLTKVEDTVDVSTSELLDINRLIVTSDEKCELHRRTGAVAVDMESAAIASVSNQSGVPFIAVRGIVDSAAMSLPDVVQTMFEQGGGSRRSLLTRLALRPLEWPGLIALARGKAAAGRSMRMVWSAAGPDLGMS
jgi:adenosylhomocysteine nucleosidase